MQQAIEATISNYRGVSAAHLLVEKITLISGINGGGKSSVCEAVGAALTGDPVPIPEVTKSSAGVLVRSGTASGKIELKSSAGITEIAWPSAKIKTSGPAPTASRFAAGLDSIVTMEPKKRIPFLIEYLKAQPEKGDLQKAVADLPLGWYVEIGGQAIGVPNGHPYHHATEGGPDGPYIPRSGTFDALWELIQKQGWDGTFAQVKEKGARLKGQWEAVTNDNYGAKKADTWIPEGYEPDLEGASEDALKACVTEARDNLEMGISLVAVDEDRRLQLQEVAGKLAERQAALSEAKSPLPEDTELKRVTGEVDHEKMILLGLQNALNDLKRTIPKAGTPPTQLDCPCCQKALMMTTGNKLAPYATTGPDQATINAHALKVTEKEQQVAAQNQKLQPLLQKLETLTTARQAAVRQWDNQLAEAARLARESSQAQEELNGMAQPAAAATGPSVDVLRNQLEKAETRLKAFQAKRDADQKHASIEINQALLSRLAPTGVRADVLTAALTTFNNLMESLSRTAGWPVTEITNDFGFTYNGTPYFLLSKAEQFRVRTVVQVAMAYRENSGMIVVDGADILDKGGRNGLFRVLAFAAIPALVGMTIDSVDKVPNLASVNMGRSYWLEGAVAKAL